MRLFSKWWETFPRREVAPTLLVALAVFGALGDGQAFLQALLGPCGFVWN